MANEYISPNNFYDYSGSWNFEQYAYDGNVESPASTLIPAFSWSNYLILNRVINSFVTPYYCSKIKFILGGYQRGINKVDIDIYYYDSVTGYGAWHDLYEGSFLDNVWTEKELGATRYLAQIRFRFYNSTSDFGRGGLFEVMFYETVGIPAVVTTAATLVEDDEATLNGNITNTGGATCTVRGFEYKEVGEDPVTTIESGSFSTGTYSKALAGLDDTKKYYFRAYATNSAGTGYGSWLSFGTDVDKPTVTSGDATGVDHESATLNGNITVTGGADVTERGFQYGLTETATWTKRETGTFGTGAFSLDIEDLENFTKYYFRAYAINAAGTSYGAWLDFTTDYSNPEVVTHNATDELEEQVTGNGQIVKTGGQDCDERGFEYGLSKVATWIKNKAGSYGVGFFDLTIDGLTANTEYWYRAYAKYSIDAEINQLTTTSYGKYNIQLQVVEDKIYLVWRKVDLAGYLQIWTGIMDLDGTNFVATKRTDTEVYSKYDPQLQVVGDKIYYVWAEDLREIWTATMDLDGTNFVATKRETNTTNTENPQFQVVGSTIYYVWIETDAGSKAQIWTATMGIDGSDWTSIERTTSAYNKFEVQFQVVEDIIYFIYAESDNIQYQIWTATMTTGGESWAATKRTTGSGDKKYPQLEVVGDTIYFVFSQQVPSYLQIFTASTGIDGSNWTATQRTDFGVWVAIHPQLQVVGDIIHYVFQKQLSSGGGADYHLYSAQMNIDGTSWTHKVVTTTETIRSLAQFQIVNGIFYCVWQESTLSIQQIWTFRIGIYIGYGEWVKFITAAPGSPGDKPSGYKNDICSDNSGYTYILNRSLTDDGATYESYFVLSTDLSGKQTLHTNKRLEDIFSYFVNKGTGTAKVYVKRDTEPAWQEAGEISLAGEEEIIIKHLPVDFLAKTYLIKFVFENDFEFIGAIFEAIPIGDRP